MKILLADDHTVVRKGLSSILSNAYPHAEIEEVGNGIDLIKKVMKGKWDIIISDISMPEKTGLEVLNELKERDIKIPVIILSVHVPELYALRCIKAGASCYLTKETAPELLVAAVNHILITGKKFITPEIAILLAGIYENNISETAHANLSNREFEVFKLLAKGKSGTEIAEAIQISAGTVSTYRTRIMEKMKLHTNADIVRYAIEHNLI